MNISFKIKYIFIAFAFITGLLAFVPAYELRAQNGPQGGLDGIAGAYPDGAKQNLQADGIAKKIIDWALYLSAIVAVLFVIYGGFLYMTSAGDATQTGKGKSTLINAIIGLVIVTFSYMIVQLVYNFIIKR